MAATRGSADDMSERDATALDDGDGSSRRGRESVVGCGHHSNVEMQKESGKTCETKLGYQTAYQAYVESIESDKSLRFKPRRRSGRTRFTKNKNVKDNCEPKETVLPKETSVDEVTMESKDKNSDEIELTTSDDNLTLNSNSDECSAKDMEIETTLNCNGSKCSDTVTEIESALSSNSNKFSGKVNEIESLLSSNSNKCSDKVTEIESALSSNGSKCSDKVTEIESALSSNGSKCYEDPVAQKETIGNIGTVTGEADWWLECNTSGEGPDSVSFDFCQQYVSQVDLTDENGTLKLGPLIGRGFEVLDLFNGMENITIDIFQSQPEPCLDPITGELENPAIVEHSSKTLNVVLLFKKIIQLTLYLACKLRVCELTKTAFVHGGGDTPISSVNILNLKHDILASVEMNLNELAKNIHKLQLFKHQRETRVGVLKLKKRLLIKLQCVLFEDDTKAVGSYLFYSDWDIINPTKTQREILKILHDHTEFVLNQTGKEACEIRNGYVKDVVQKLSNEKDKDMQYLEILMREAKRQSTVNKMEQDLAESILQEQPSAKHQKLLPTGEFSVKTNLGHVGEKRTGQCSKKNLEEYPENTHDQNQVIAPNELTGKEMSLSEKLSERSAGSLLKKSILPKTMSDGNPKSNEKKSRELPQMSINRRELLDKLNNKAFGLSPQMSSGGKGRKLHGTSNKTALGLLLQVPNGDGTTRTLIEPLLSNDIRIPMLFGADKRKLTESSNNKDSGKSLQMSTDETAKKLFIKRSNFNSHKYVFDPAVQQLLIETGAQDKRKTDNSDSNSNCTPRIVVPTVICIPQDCKEHAMNLMMNFVNPFRKHGNRTRPLKIIDYPMHTTITGLISSGQYAPVMKSIQTRYLQTIEVLRASKFDYKIWRTVNKIKHDSEKHRALMMKRAGKAKPAVIQAAVSIKILSHLFESQMEDLLDDQTKSRQTGSETDGLVDHFVDNLERRIAELNRIASLTSCLSGQFGSSKEKEVANKINTDSQDRENVPKTNLYTDSSTVQGLQGLNAPETTLGQFDVHDTNTAFLVPFAAEGYKTATRNSTVYKFRSLRELFENAKQKPNLHQTSNNQESPNWCVVTLPKASIFIRDVKAFLESRKVTFNESIPNSPQKQPTVNQTVGSIGQVPTLNQPVCIVGQVTNVSQTVGTVGQVATVNQLAGTVRQVPTMKQQVGIVGQIPTMNQPVCIVGQVQNMNQPMGTVRQVPTMNQLAGTVRQVQTMNQTVGTIGQVPTINRLAGTVRQVPTMNQTVSTSGQVQTMNQLVGTVRQVPTMNQTVGTVRQVPTMNQTVGTIGQVTTMNQLVGTFRQVPTMNQTVGTIGQVTTMNQTVGTVTQVPTMNQTVGTIGQVQTMNQTVGTIGQVQTMNQTVGIVGQITSMNQTVGTIGQVPTINQTVGTVRQVPTMNQTVGTSGQVQTINQTVGTVGQITKIIRVPPESVAIKRPIALLVANKSPIGMPISGTILPMTVDSNSIKVEVDVKPSMESLAAVTVSADNMKQSAKNPNCCRSNDYLLNSIKTEPVDEDSLTTNQPGNMVNQGNQNGTQLKPSCLTVNTTNDAKGPIVKHVFSCVNNGNLCLQNINAQNQHVEQPGIAVSFGNNCANLVSNPLGTIVSNAGFDRHVQCNTIVSQPHASCTHQMINPVGYDVNKDGISLPSNAPAFHPTVNKDHSPAMQTSVPIVQPIVSPYVLNVYSAQGVPSAPEASTSSLQMSLIQSKKYFGTQTVSNPASASVSIESQTHPIIAANLKGLTAPNVAATVNTMLQMPSEQSEQLYDIVQGNENIAKVILDAATVMLTCNGPDGSMSESLLAPGSDRNKRPAAEISKNDGEQTILEDRDWSSVAPDSIGKDSPQSSLLYSADQYCRVIVKLMHNFIHGMCAPSENDSMHGPPEKDSMYGPPEKDSMHGPPEKDSMYGPPEKDSMCGPPEKDSMYGPPEKDSMCGPPKKESTWAPPEKETSCSLDADTISDSVLKIKDVFSLQAPSGCKEITDSSSYSEQTIQDRRNEWSHVLATSMEKITGKLNEKIVLHDGTELKVETSDDYNEQQQPKHKADAIENDVIGIEKVVSEESSIVKKKSQNPSDEVPLVMEQHRNHILKTSVQQENTDLTSQSNSQQFNSHRFEMVEKSIERVNTLFNQNACVLFESFLDELLVEVKLSKNEVDQIKYLFKQLKQKTKDEGSMDTDDESGICKTVVKQYRFKRDDMTEIVYHIFFVKIYPFNGFKRVWFTNGGEIFGYAPEHLELCTIVEDVKGSKLFLCCICNLNFKTMDNYLKHETNSHSKSLLYACSKCQLTFLSSEGLSNHACKEVSLDSKEKERQETLLRTKGEFIESELCHACFYLKKNYKKVAEFLKHPKKARFQFCCEICGCEILYQSEFNQHMTMHTLSPLGYTRKKCNICRKQCVRCFSTYDDQYCKCNLKYMLNIDLEKGIPSVHRKPNIVTKDLPRGKIVGGQTSKQKVVSIPTSHALLTALPKQNAASKPSNDAFIIDVRKQKVASKPSSDAFIIDTRKQNVVSKPKSHAFITDTPKQSVASGTPSDSIITDTHKQTMTSIPTSCAIITVTPKQSVASGKPNDVITTDARRKIAYNDFLRYVRNQHGMSDSQKQNLEAEQTDPIFHNLHQYSKKSGNCYKDTLKLNSDLPFSARAVLMHPHRFRELTAVRVKLTRLRPQSSDQTPDTIRCEESSSGRKRKCSEVEALIGEKKSRVTITALKGNDSFMPQIEKPNVVLKLKSGNGSIDLTEGEVLSSWNGPIDLMEEVVLSSLNGPSDSTEGKVHSLLEWS